MSGQFARLRNALDRVGTTTPGTIVGVFAEDLTAIMNHYVEVVKEAAELKAARAQPAITSETGNQAAQGASAITSESAQAEHDCDCGRKWKHTTYGWASTEPAQAGALLSDEEIQAAWVEHGLDDCAVEDFARAIEQAVRSKLGAGVGWQLVGYYHKAPSGDPNEDDMFFADAINGDCPDCHPLYMDASVNVTAKAERYPMTVEQQTDAAKAMSIKANHDPHIISFMMGIEAAERHHGIVGKEGA